MFICLRGIYGCFCAKTAVLSSCEKTICPAQPKIFILQKQFAPAVHRNYLGGGAGGLKKKYHCLFLFPHPLPICNPSDSNMKD